MTAANLVNVAVPTSIYYVPTLTGIAIQIIVHYSTHSTS